MSAFSSYVLSTLGAPLYLRLGEPSGSSAVDAAGNQNGVYQTVAGITYAKAGVSNDGNTGIELNGCENLGYVSIADNAAQRSTDVFTWGGFVRLDELYTTRTLWSPGAAGGAGIGVNPGGTIYLSKDGTAVIATSTVGLADGLKHFVVVVKNAGTSTKIYFDRGVDVTGAVSNQTIAHPNNGYLLGKYWNSSTQYFMAGFADEVFMIPGLAASQGQVQALYDLAFLFTAAPIPAVAAGALSASLSAGSTNQAASGGTTYGWRRNKSALGGATGTTYTFVSGDRAQEIDVVATATSAAGFTTEQASRVALSPTVTGSTWTRAPKPLLGQNGVSAEDGTGTGLWEPTVVIDTDNSLYVMFCDAGLSTAKGLYRFTCPLASDPTVTANWTKTGVVIASGNAIGSPTVVVQGTTWRLYYYNDSTISPLLTRTSTDKGVTWSSATTAIAAAAVAWSQGWDGTTAWPTNGDPTSANWEMLVGGTPAGSGGLVFALAYATSTDHGATYTPQNGGFYTTPADITAKCRGGGPWLATGAPISGVYYLFDHISGAGVTTPTDMILATSTDLTNLAGWTLVGHMIDHNAAEQMTSLQIADPCVVEHGGTTYVFYTGDTAPETPAPPGQVGNVEVASFPGTFLQFLLPVPVNTVAPVASGVTSVGEAVSCTTGTWTDDGSPGYSYQWQRDNSGGGTYSNIVGAAANSHVVVAADVGCQLRCRVTDTDSRGATTANSNALGPAVLGGSIQAHSLSR